MITTINEWHKNNLLEASKKDKTKDLIIVDVQKEFSKYFTNTYLEELNDLCYKYGRVYQIWDTTKAKKASYLFPNQSMVLSKKYGGKLEYEDINNFFDPIQVEQIQKEWYDKKPGWHKFTINGDMWLYVEGQHKWGYFNKELIDIIKRIAQTDREVVLVGGADNECLYDIEVLLKAFNITYEKDPKFVYSAKGCYFKDALELIESVVKQKKDKEIFNYRSVVEDAWRPIIKEAQEFFKINFDLENNDSAGDKRTIYVKRNLRKDQPIKYEFNCELCEAGGDWEMPVMYFKVEVTYSQARFTHDMKVKYIFDYTTHCNRKGNIQLNNCYVLIPSVENGNHLEPSQKEGWFTAVTDDKKGAKITDEDINSAWKWLENHIEEYVEERHHMLDENDNVELSSEPSAPIESDKIKESIKLILECVPPKIIQSMNKVEEIIKPLKHLTIDFKDMSNVFVTFENLGDMDKCQEYLNSLGITTTYDDNKALLLINIFQNYFGFI